MPASTLRFRFLPLLLSPVLPILLGACGEPDPRAPDTPTLEQTRADVVGHGFVFFEDETGPRRWTIEDGEVTEAAIVDDALSAGSRTLRRRLALTLASRNRTIEGEAFAYYERAAADSLADEDGWTLTDLVRAGDNFEARDRFVVLYAVERDTRPPVDDRSVFVEPIAVIDEGTLSAPLSPFAADLDSVATFGPRWLADSVRAARLEGGVERWALNPARGLWAIDAAQGSVPTPIRTTLLDLVPCRTVRGEARASRPLSPDVTLAATSSVYSGGLVGRLPTGDEQRLLLSFARERLRAAGAPDAALRRIRPGRVLAADLDGDGRAELLGSFDATELRDDAPRTWRLFLIGRPDVSGKLLTPLAEVTRDDAGPARTLGQFALLGALDLDGAGAAEVIVQQAGPLGTKRYLILGRTDSGWAPVYEGAVSGCLTEADAYQRTRRDERWEDDEDRDRRRSRRDRDDVIGW